MSGSARIDVFNPATGAAFASATGFFGGAAFGFVPSAVAKLVQVYVFMRGTGVAAD